VRNLLYRSRFVSAALLLFLSVGTFSVGTAFAATPSQFPSKNQQAIDGLYSSTRLAVNSLQKSPVSLQVVTTALIIGGAKAELSHLADPSSPGTIVGGLDLDAYCQSIGDVNSYTAVPGVETTGGAYTWDCVSTSGSQTLINMQAACLEQYPGQVTTAYAQDPNNSYSWVCITPIAGTFFDPTTDTTVDSITTPNSAAMLVTAPGSEYLTLNDNGNTASDILTIEGASMAYGNNAILNATGAKAAAASSTILKLDGFGN
jgi:hypothetical protein